MKLSCKLDEDGCVAIFKRFPAILLEVDLEDLKLFPTILLDGNFAIIALWGNLERLKEVLDIFVHRPVSEGLG